MPRYAARVDANQPEIVEALRGVGATVAHLHTLGNGVPDICAGYRGVNYLIEIKDGRKPPSRQKLTKDEAAFFGDWRGQVAIASSVDEALAIIGAT